MARRWCGIVPTRYRARFPGESHEFTIAVTVYKTPQHLPRALQTVLAQTLSDWEILVYSDGRSPESERVVEQPHPDVPVRYRRVRRRRGLYGNHLRRLALEEGTGAHVCYLGHDCLLYPTCLQAHADLIAVRREAMSVVPVAYWKNYERKPSQPIGEDLMRLGEGDVDLLCVAYPRELALELDCFGKNMQDIRCADFLANERLRQRTPPVYRSMPEQGAHF